MKITVIGATRGIGRCLVDHALEEGHEVTALARKPDRLERSHDRLAVVEGDILDAASKISRNDVAHFVLRELAEKQYDYHMPLLTY